MRRYMQVLSGKRLQNTLARPSISLGSQLIICATLLFTPFRAGITDEAMNKISLPHSYSRFFCHTILQRSLLPARRINGIFLRENRRRGRNPHTNGKKKGNKEGRQGPEQGVHVMYVLLEAFLAEILEFPFDLFFDAHFGKN